MESNDTPIPEVTVAAVKKRGRPKGIPNKAKKPRKKLEPNPEHVALLKSGKTASESEPDFPQEVAGQAEESKPWVHRKEAQKLRKKYPIAWKWPDQKFWHCMVIPGDYLTKTLENGGDIRAVPITIDRGVGSPVNILMNKQCVLPNEIVEAIKDMTVQYPKIVTTGPVGEIPENANGFNGFELRSRYKVMVVGPATPEEYEANVSIGKKRA